MSTKPKTKAKAKDPPVNHSSLSSIVSHLVRSSFGDAASAVPDDQLDRHVADLLLAEAKEKEKAWGTRGTRAYFDQEEAPVRKPNKRFLSAIIKNVDGHNSALKRAEEDTARRREQDERRAAEEWRRSQRRARERGSSEEEEEEREARERRRRRRRERENEERRRDGDDKVAPSTRREHDENQPSSRRQDEIRPSSSHPEEGDRHSSSSRRKEDHASSRNDGDEFSGQHHHRSSRKREHDDDDKGEREHPVEGKEKDKGKARLVELSAEETGSSSSLSREAKDALPPHSSKPSKRYPPTAPLPPSPPPPLPSGPPPSKMDKYFSSSYDPRLDISLPDLTAPNGLIAEGAFDNWDTMLRLVKERKEERREREAREKEARHRERERIREERRKKKRKGKGSSSEEEGPKPPSVQTGGSGTSLLGGNYQYVKKGGMREWDSGKEALF